MDIRSAAVLLSRSRVSVGRWVRALRLGRRRMKRVTGTASGRASYTDLSEVDILALRRALAGELGTLEQSRQWSAMSAGALVPKESGRKSLHWRGR